MVPQARTRAPNAVAVPAVDPIPELMPPPGGMPRAPLAAEAAQGSEDTGHGVGDVSRGEDDGVPNPGTFRRLSASFEACDLVVVPWRQNTTSCFRFCARCRAGTGDAADVAAE